MTYKQVQEEEIKRFDDKFLQDFDMEIVSWNTDEPSIDKIKSHLLSAMQRSALAVLKEVRERCEELKKDTSGCGSFCHCSSHPHNDCLSIIATTLNEIEKEITK